MIWQRSSLWYKLVSLALTLMLIVPVLTACGDGDGEEGPATRSLTPSATTPPDTAAQLLASILDKPEISEVLFYPRETWTSVPSGAQDHLVPVEEGVSISCRYYPVSDDSPCILFFHGNGEVASDYDSIAPLYNQRGISLFIAGYRGYGLSDGSPTFSNMLSDAKEILDFFIDTIKRDSRDAPVFVMGRSLGSFPAVALASHYPEHLAGMIVQGAPIDIGRVLSYLGYEVAEGEAEELEDAALSMIGSITLPSLVIHGDADRLVPATDAARFLETVGSEKKQLVLIPGAGHNDVIQVGREQYFSAIEEFVFGEDEALSPGNEGELPARHVGDQWIYKLVSDSAEYTFTETVTGQSTIEGVDCWTETFSFEPAMEGTRIVDVWTVKETLFPLKMEAKGVHEGHPYTAVTDYSYVLPEGFSWWPLKVGKKGEIQETQATTVMSGGEVVSRESKTVTVVMEVEKKEETVVLAGKFDAFKMVEKGEDGAVYRVYWYSDKAGNDVKGTEYSDGQASAWVPASSMELKSYQLSSSEETYAP